MIHLEESTRLLSRPALYLTLGSPRFLKGHAFIKWVDMTIKDSKLLIAALVVEKELHSFFSHRSMYFRSLAHVFMMKARKILAD